MRDLSSFTLGDYDKGRSKVVQALWFATLNLVFYRWWCPARFRVTLLRAFGASVGKGVHIRHRVRVHWPWKLSVGDNCWIGESAWILNLEPVTIEDHVCISQDAMLCTGGHDHRRSDFGYRNGPITLRRGSWVCVRGIVLAGVEIGELGVVGANTVAAKDVAPNTIVTGSAPVIRPYELLN